MRRGGHHFTYLASLICILLSTYPRTQTDGHSRIKFTFMVSKACSRLALNESHGR